MSLGVARQRLRLVAQPGCRGGDSVMGAGVAAPQAAGRTINMCTDLRMQLEQQRRQ